MITVSDNGRADAIYSRVGGAALRALAERAGMRRFTEVGYWSGALFSAADQARFFAVFDRLTPPRSRAYARSLLSSIVSLPALGLLALLSGPRLQDVLQGRLAPHLAGAPRARGGALRARAAEDLDGGADRRQSLPRLRHRHAAGGGAADLRRLREGGRRRARWRLPGTRAGRPASSISCAPAWWTCTARARHPSRAGLPHAQQPHGAAPAGLLRELGAPARARRPRPRPRAAPPAPPGAGPAGARRVPAGARLPRAGALGP